MFRPALWDFLNLWKDYINVSPVPKLSWLGLSVQLFAAGSPWSHIARPWYRRLPLSYLTLFVPMWAKEIQVNGLGNVLGNHIIWHFLAQPLYLFIPQMQTRLVWIYTKQLIWLFASIFVSFKLVMWDIQRLFFFSKQFLKYLPSTIHRMLGR